jgi:uncharacterized membrane-anchored protein
MLKPPLRILIVAALCVLGLITLVVRESMARDAGQEVLLAMEAVDPRSLLSGHYVIVDLREQLAADQPCPPYVENMQWVALRPEGDRYTLAGGATERAAAAQLGPLVARGEFDCFQPTAPPGEDVVQGSITLRLGLERFHIHQAEAERIDRILREQVPGEAARIYAIVSIGRDGTARLKGLLVDDERVELSWL